MHTLNHMHFDIDRLSFCRGLFATHYHRLADAHEQDANVAICHMGCSVEDGINGGPEQVCCHPVLACRAQNLTLHLHGIARNSVIPLLIAQAFCIITVF